MNVSVEFAASRPRRSELAVPAGNQRFVAKALASEAELVFLDLEDGVAPDARAEARRAAVAALLRDDWGSRLRAVRVNATASPWYYEDLIGVVEAAGSRLDLVILPKVEQPGDVYMTARLLEQIEARRGFGRPITIEAQIETARGMAQVEAIAASSRRLDALCFGPGDFAASIGAPILEIGGEAAGYPGHVWHAALSRIVVAARANGLQAIDGPYGAFRDAAGLERSAALARALGCDGKWAIHPDQLAPINAAFAPTPAELERARAIVERYGRAAGAEGRGAVALDGELIDAASLRMALRVLGRQGDGGNAETRETR